MVSFPRKEAVVTFDPAQASVEQLIDAVGRVCFRATLKPGGKTAPVP